jgi:prevent-host-death family protein
MPEHFAFDVAETKRRFSELIGRVAFGGATVVVTRRGKPMAKLVPYGAPAATPHLANVAGWLDDEHPFLAAVSDIVASRRRHRPRVLARGSKGPARGRRRPR